MDKASRVPDHYLAVDGWFHAALFSLKELYIQPFLQLLQQLAGCGLRRMHGDCCTPHASEFGQSIEQHDLSAGYFQINEAI
jgi:hypothetical protein